MTFSQRHQLWWKQGRALFPACFPSTGKGYNTIFSAEEKKILAWDKHQWREEALLCLQRAGDRGGGTKEDTPVPVKCSWLSAHKAA